MLNYRGNIWFAVRPVHACIFGNHDAALQTQSFLSSCVNQHTILPKVSECLTVFIIAGCSYCVLPIVLKLTLEEWMQGWRMGEKRCSNRTKCSLTLFRLHCSGGSSPVVFLFVVWSIIVKGHCWFESSLRAGGRRGRLVTGIQRLNFYMMKHSL